MGAMLFLTACSDTESITPDDTTKYDGTLEMAEGAEPTPITIYAEDVTGDQIKVLVKMTSTDKNLRRVYITRNVAGAGDEPYTYESDGVENNGDGSMNLSADKIFNFELNIPKNANLTGGTEVYKIWATNGKGDYRDSNNSFVAGVGSVTVSYGAGNNPEAAVKSFSAKILAAPLADGTSESFISVVNGQLYKVAGASETVKFWDFGYYYGANDHASLASPKSYPDAIINIPSKAGVADAELNQCFFKASTMTPEQFDAITTQGQLNSITTSTTQIITGLAADDVIEFVDAYGKKGLIKVVKVQGTYNNGDYIQIDVKVQR